LPLKKARADQRHTVGPIYLSPDSDEGEKYINDYFLGA
jgi:hypothetical protein